MWTLPKPPENEAERLNILMARNIMDSNRDERFDRLTRLATRIYDADVAFMGLVDADFQWMKSISSDTLAPCVPRRDSVCNLIIESGRPMVIGDLKTDPRLEGHPLLPFLTMRFYAGVPLIAEKGTVLGTFCVMRREASDAEAFDVEPLQELAAIGMDAIELWRLTQELRRKSEIDALTGLPNRGHFDEAIERAVRRSHRTQASLSLLMIDIDHFKQINDSAGHQEGDRVLERLGALLAKAPHRPLDTVARYGGEEFAIILPDTDETGARAVAEKVRAALAAEAMPHPSGKPVTVSIGLAV